MERKTLKSFYIDGEQARQLKKLAKETGVSQGVYLREALSRMFCARKYNGRHRNCAKNNPNKWCYDCTEKDKEGS